jgi:hypothetical protein
MSAQRCCVCEPTRLRTCKLCGEAFAIVRKAGRPREFCFVCEPPGWQVVKVPGQDRTKLRRRPPQFSRMSARSGASVLRWPGDDAA